MRRGLLGFAVATLLLAAAGSASAQCTMCRTALTSSAEGREIGEQFNRAILLMIAAPYVVMGAVGMVVFRHRLRSPAGRLRRWLEWRGLRRRLRG